MMLVKLPRQKAPIPCSLATRLKQFTIPVYRGTSPEMIFGLASCVWMMSLTRSIGAVAVFATAPETPPAKKLMTKSDMMEYYVWIWNCDIIQLENLCIL